MSEEAREQPTRLPSAAPELIIERKDFNLQAHNWRQEGRELICDGACDFGYRHGHTLRDGMMLTGTKGDWHLGPERGILRPAAK